MANQGPIVVRPLPVRDQQGLYGNVAVTIKSTKVPTAANAVHLFDTGTAATARRHIRAGEYLCSPAGFNVPGSDLSLIW